jgi:hypothetical protein
MKEGGVQSRAREVDKMAKSNPYHTDSLEYRPEYWNVYHDHEDCPEGKKILDIHREYGTGGKERCKECIKLG